MQQPAQRVQFQPEVKQLWFMDSERNFVKVPNNRPFRHYSSVRSLEQRERELYSALQQQVIEKHVARATSTEQLSRVTSKVHVKRTASKEQLYQQIQQKIQATKQFKRTTSMDQLYQYYPKLIGGMGLKTPSKEQLFQQVLAQQQQLQMLTKQQQFLQTQIYYQQQKMLQKEAEREKRRQEREERRQSRSPHSLRSASRERIQEQIYKQQNQVICL